MLLKSKSEQERRLLAALVNKVSCTFYFFILFRFSYLYIGSYSFYCLNLFDIVFQLGDPENKTASSADYHLSNLLSDHPNMKVYC